MSKVEWKRLVEIANILYGYPFESSLFTEDDSFIPLIRIRDVKPAKASTYYSGKILVDYVIKKGEILVGMDGEFNMEKWNDRDGLLNQRVLKMSGTDGLCENGYLYHYMGPVFKKIEKETAGGSVKHLSAKVINSITIPIPSPPEQARIVGILDTFTASIDNLKEQIALRRKQYEYYRDQLLDLEGKEGVEMKTIGEIAKYRRGSFPQPYGNKEWYDGEGAMPFVQVADVEENGMKLKRITKQCISKLAMPKSVYAPIGTILVTLQGSIGKVAITQYESYVDRTLGIFEGFTIDINKKYFAYQLEKIFAIKKEKARGGTIKTITKEEFTDFTIPLPYPQEQSRIVSILNTFETSIQNLEAQLKQREKQYEYYRNKLLTFE